jgi:hypothetical protein
MIKSSLKNQTFYLFNINMKKEYLMYALSAVLGLTMSALAASASTTISTNISTGNASTTGPVTIAGNLMINGMATTTASNGNFAMQGALTVAGAASITGNASTTGAASFADNIIVAGQAGVGTTTPATGTALTVGVNSGSSNASTTIYMGKIQFQGQTSTGATICMYATGTAPTILKIALGACNN